MEDVTVGHMYVWVTKAFIVIKRRGGGIVYSAPVDNFTEPCAEVLTRLRAAVGLPEDADAGTSPQT